MRLRHFRIAFTPLSLVLEVIRILNLRFIVYFVFALVLLGIGFMCGSFYQHIEKTQTISMMDATSEICSTNIEKQRLFALRRLIWTINDYKTTHTDLDTSFSDDFFVDKKEKVLICSTLVKVK